MSQLKPLIPIIAKHPCAFFGFTLFISAFSLASAFTAEIVFGLEPCIMCLYQRYPFALGIILGVAGLVLKRNPKAVQVLTSLCSINFLANSGVAFYHTGIERHWWLSVSESCSITPIDNEATPQTIFENIMSAPTGRCDEIPWADPLLGLSMANYNVVMCLGIAVLSLLFLIIYRKYRG